MRHETRDQRGHYYVCCKRYEPMAIAEIRPLRQLGEENRIEQLVADLTVDQVMVLEVPQKRTEAQTEACVGRAVDGPVSDWRVSHAEA